jgi:phenylacetate-CoA ligase
MLRQLMPEVLGDLARYGQMAPSDLRSYQFLQLKQLVAFHFTNNSTYRSMCETSRVSPSDLQSLADIRRLPIIERDFLKTFGFHHGDGGALSIRPSELTTFLTSSGSTGTPKRIPIAPASSSSIWQTTAMALWIAGIRGHEEQGGGPIMPMWPHGPFPSGFFQQNGCEIIGFSARSDIGMPLEWHLRTLVDIGAKYITTSPSFLSAFGDYASGRVDLPSLKLKRIVLLGEYFGEDYRRAMERRFGTTIRDAYGSGEIGNVAAEGDALHTYLPGHLYHLAHKSIIEVVKVGTDEPVPVGDPGEMLITVFDRIEWPVLRYRMGDVISQRSEDGTIEQLEHRFPIISRIRGRADDMLIYGGVNLYQETIFRALAAYNDSPICPLRVSYDKFVFSISQTEQFRPSAKLAVEVATRSHAEKRELDGRVVRAAQEGILAVLLRQSDELLHATTIAGTVLTPVIEVHEAGALYNKESKLRRMVDNRLRKD